MGLDRVSKRPGQSGVANLVAAATILASGFAYSGRAAAGDADLVTRCKDVLRMTPASRAVWLRRDLFAFEMAKVTKSSNPEMRMLRDNLLDTCGRVSHNNKLIKTRVSRASEPDVDGRDRQPVNEVTVEIEFVETLD